MYFSEACMNFPAIMLIINPSDGSIISANKKAESTYGYSIEKLCTMNIKEINVLKPDQIKQELLNAKLEQDNIFLFPHKTITGKIINMEVQSYPTLIEDKSYLMSLIYPSEERNIYNTVCSELMDKSSDSIMVIDKSNRVIRVNPIFESLFNTNLLDIIGEFANDVLCDVSKTKYDFLFEELSKGHTQDIYFAKIDDKETKFKLTGIPTFYLDCYLGAILSIQKVDNFNASELKKYNELEDTIQHLGKINSIKSDFLARMSHDMRTPMNAILGIANFGIEESSDPKSVEYFSQIKDSSDYLLALINDILDMQKLENGEIKLENNVTQLGELAKKVKNIIEPRAAQKNIELVYDLECESLNTYIKIDSRRVQQIMINILNNAIKYTKPGGHVIWKNQICRLSNNKIKIRNEFLDNGVGMSQDFLKHMFSPFTTERNSQTSSECGSGLGLAITKSLVESMGGKISCTSVLNEGTTFIIELLYDLATKEDIKNHFTIVDCNKDYGVINNKKILICEDIDINIMILKKLLSKFNCKIDVAANGKEGVELVDKNSYDLILMDIRMPVMSGIDATLIIRKTNQTVPIIALSANAYTDDIEKSLSSGMNAHLAKPIIKNELYSTIASLINGSIRI